MNKETRAKILEAMGESISKLSKRDRKRLLIGVEKRASEKTKEEKCPA